MPKRVIVDENAGPGTEIWRQFQRAFGGEQYEYVFLGQAHRGISDLEILDTLLRPDIVLLTGDCVLHARALERGCRSYTLNDCGQLTRKQPLLWWVIGRYCRRVFRRPAVNQVGCGLCGPINDYATLPHPRYMNNPG